MINIEKCSQKLERALKGFLVSYKVTGNQLAVSPIVLSPYRPYICAIDKNEWFTSPEHLKLYYTVNNETHEFTKALMSNLHTYPLKDLRVGISVCTIIDGQKHILNLGMFRVNGRVIESVRLGWLRIGKACGNI